MGESKGYIRSIDEKGSINISEDVVAVIAAAAAAEAEGVHTMFFTPGKELTNMLGRKGLARGVKLLIEEDDIVIDVYIIAKIDHSVSEVGAEVQRLVMSAVEAAVGVAVKAVNVHICGVALKKNRTTL